MRSTVLAIFALALASPASTTGPSPGAADEVTSAAVPLSNGLGEGPHARLAMRFEVTFLKIDVADVEAWLDPATAAGVAALVSEQERNGESRDAIASLVLGARSMLLTMRYLREASHGRLMKGIRNGFEAAHRSGLVSEEAMERTHGELVSAFDVLADRGVKTGDRLVYRVDGDVLQVLYADPAGAELVRETYRGEEWAIGMKGAFFGRRSKFRDELVRSVSDES